MACVLNGCKQKKAKKQAKSASAVVLATYKNQTEPLYFRGVLSPIRRIAVLAPVNGRVVATHFFYGQAVKTIRLSFSI